MSGDEVPRSSPSGDPGGPASPPPAPGSPPHPNHPAGAAEFRLTFGVKYQHDPHPRGAWITAEGWITIVAPSYEEARRVAVDLFGRWWSDLYGPETFDPIWFPAGELLRIVVPAGLIELEDHRV